MSCEISSDTQRRAVVDRCGNRCEAEVHVSALDVWTRCFAAPVEVHHALYRSRGGELLDRAGEDAHLLGLCLRHHRHAHLMGGEGLVIEGYVTTGVDGRPHYVGPDTILSAKYGR